MGPTKMKIAVLSGKGGTGKTFIAVNLAAAAQNATYLDCDIEEPNGHLFFKPANLQSEKVTVGIPFVAEKLCTGCRQCVEFCRFNALAYANNKLLIFDEVCHSCGGCILFCPEQALTEKAKVIGEVQRGISENVTVLTGMLNTGEPSGVPIIKKLLEKTATDDGLAVIDCPPGSACVVMESIRDADYCLLVAEPTLFGLHNLQIVWELVRLFEKPYGVVLNKCLDGDNPAEEFCREKQLKVLAKIAFDADLGRLNSNGIIAFRANQKYQKQFAQLLQAITREVQHETAVNP